jgi:DNA-binding NarL/FixJ family response regulator
MDFSLPDMRGPAAAAKIRAYVPGVAIVFHSAEDSEAALVDAIDAGATAYLTKSATPDQLVDDSSRSPDVKFSAVHRQRVIGSYLWTSR